MNIKTNFKLGKSVAPSGSGGVPTIFIIIGVFILFFIIRMLSKKDEEGLTKGK